MMSDYERESFDQLPEMMDSRDVAEYLGCCRATAITYMKQPGFPLLNPLAKRCLKVNKYRFREWLRAGAADVQAI